MTQGCYSPLCAFTCQPFLCPYGYITLDLKEFKAVWSSRFALYWISKYFAHTQYLWVKCILNTSTKNAPFNNIFFLLRLLKTQGYLAFVTLKQLYSFECPILKCAHYNKVSLWPFRSWFVSCAPLFKIKCSATLKLFMYLWYQAVVRMY